MNYNEFITFINGLTKNEKCTRVKDGIYDVTDIDFIIAESDKLEALIEWTDKRDKFWFASAYQTEYFILYAEEPRKFKGTWYGNGFNYGSTNVITDCPKSILILAEDD